MTNKRELWQGPGIDRGAYKWDPDKGLDRSINVVQWEVPREITLNATRELLLWRAGPPFERVQSPGRRLLDSFVKLGGAPPERIEKYARRWGVLRLHGAPTRLHRRAKSLLAHESEERQRHAHQWDTETVDAWRFHARRAEALVSVAAALQSGGSGSAEDWRTIDPDETGWPPQGNERAVLAWHLNQWLDKARVRMKVYWHAEQQTPHLMLQPYGLFGALGLELSAAISHTDRLAICSGCGRSYTRPNRRAKVGQRNFCPTCRATGVDRLLAKRDERGRKAVATGKTGV